MKCPNCDSDKVIFMNKDLKNCDGKNFSHECLKCGAFMTREDVNKNFKPGKEVLMEENMKRGLEQLYIKNNLES